jgi:predicted enzyme related to lactoylglutathione lyase
MTPDTALAVNLVKVEVDRVKRFFTAVFQRTTQRYDDRNSNRALGSRSVPKKEESSDQQGS